MTFCRSIILLFAVLTPAWSFASEQFQRVRMVVIVSIDGGRPDLLRSNDLPTIQRLIREGAWSMNGSTVMPSRTLPSHVSMLTSVRPSTHGITWNEWRPERGAVSIPTIFSRAKSAGFGTVLLAAKEKFRHLDIAGSLDAFTYSERTSEQMAGIAVKELEKRNSGLVFVHLPDVDVAGHLYGWGSREQFGALKSTDRALARILQKVDTMIAKDVAITLIITGDHGGTGKDHGSERPTDSRIPWIAYGRNVQKGPLFSPIQTIDTSSTAAWLLGVEPAKEWEGKPIKAAFCEDSCFEIPLVN